MAPSTDTHLAMDACPPLEDIAAFLDGTLLPEERERVTEHLARCESCYEIFAGAVHFQEESSAEGTQGRGVLRFPLASDSSRSGESSDAGIPDHARSDEEEKQQRVQTVRTHKRTSTRWLPLAASILLAAPLGFLIWQSFIAPPKLTVAGLVNTIDGDAKIAERLYSGKRLRGSGDPGLLWDRSLFMAGVHLIDLRLSVAHSGMFENTRDLLQSLGIELQAVPMTQDLGENYEQEYLALSPDFDTAQLGPRLLEKEAALQERIFDSLPFSFGLWTEAGRLAAATQTQEFFETRKNRRFLSHLQKTLPGQLAPELQDPVLEDLQAIEHTWDQGELSKEDYGMLARRFENIIQRIDDYEEHPLLEE